VDEQFRLTTLKNTINVWVFGLSPRKWFEKSATDEHG
jgi:hypothetical protein